MKATSIVLIGLFIAQLAVAGVLYYNTLSQRAVRPQGSLLALDSDAISQISIDGEGESVALERQPDGWLIKSSGLPAEQSRVEQAIQTFSDMKLGWAVASTKSSHQQLEVADDKYQRRVKISSGEDTVGDIFIGTSPGFKRSHVRVEGADDVYSVAVNTFDLPTTVVDWLDKALLQVADVASVTIKDKVLEKTDDQWTYDGNDGTDQEKAEALINALESLRVTDIATVDTGELDFESVVLTAGDGEYEYRFANHDSDYLVVRQGIDSVFKIAETSYDEVIAADLLLPEPEPETTPSADPTREANVSGDEQAVETVQPSPSAGEAGTTPTTEAKE